MGEDSQAIAPRKNYKVILKATVHGEAQDSAFLCTSQDLSSSGILIETDRDLNKGDRITFSFFLPGASKITADGEMVRSEKKGDGTLHYGIRFIDLKEESRQAIEWFIDSCARR
ncbi:MAG TPA: PilZ domain-containing protein [Geobacteraceae bacterium]